MPLRALSNKDREALDSTVTSLFEMPLSVPHVELSVSRRNSFQLILSVVPADTWVYPVVSEGVPSEVAT